MLRMRADGCRDFLLRVTRGAWYADSRVLCVRIPQASSPRTEMVNALFLEAGFGGSDW